jgi:hypothetical protein
MTSYDLALRADGVQKLTPASRTSLSASSLRALYAEAGGDELQWLWLVWGEARSEGLRVRIDWPELDTYIDGKLNET